MYKCKGKSETWVLNCWRNFIAPQALIIVHLWLLPRRLELMRFFKREFFNIFDFLFEICPLFQKNFPKLFHFLGRFSHTVCTRKLSKRLSCSGPLIVPRKQYYIQPYILLTLKARKRPSKAIHYSMLSSLDFPENGAFRSIMFH